MLAQPGPGTWRNFLDHWGVRRTHRPTALPSTPIPAPLREFHGGVPELGFNRLVALDELEADGPRVVICVEEQGAFRWALLAEDAYTPDPPVWGSTGDPGDPWTLQAPSLSVFLGQILVLEASFGGLAHAAWGTHGQVPPAVIDPVLDPLGELPWPHWSWPPDEARFLAGEGTVAFATCEDGDGDRWCSAWVGARDAAAAARFRGLATGDDWIWFGRPPVDR